MKRRTNSIQGGKQVGKKEKVTIECSEGRGEGEFGVTTKKTANEVSGHPGREGQRAGTGRVTTGISGKKKGTDRRGE